MTTIISDTPPTQEQMKAMIAPTVAYGAELHRSPGPMAVVGYEYETWPFGKRKEVYRVPVEEDNYNQVVARIRRSGGTMEQKDRKLFAHFKPMTAERLNELRTELKAERISYGELHEIDCACDKAGIDTREGSEDPMLAEDKLDALETARGGVTAL